MSVRPDGRISVPLIEDITAAGETPTQLARDIEQRLKKYVQDPNVTVIVRSFIGPSDRQIRVIGEATDPAAIHARREHMTLLDVMIATKGLTKYAAGNRAEIIRLEPDGKARDHIRVRLNDLSSRTVTSVQNMRTWSPATPLRSFRRLGSRRGFSPRWNPCGFSVEQYLRAAWRRSAGSE